MHPHHLAASALILPLIVVTLGYIAACVVWPFARLPQVRRGGPPPLPVRPRLAVLPPLPRHRSPPPHRPPHLELPPQPAQGRPPMTPATDHYTWPVPSPADTARALAGISGDIRRGLPPKIDDALIFLAAVRAARHPRPRPAHPVHPHAQGPRAAGPGARRTSGPVSSAGPPGSAPRPRTGCARACRAGGGRPVTAGHPQDRPCTGYGPAGPCGATPTRLYPAGPRCPAHTPAALAGQPEPGAGRYCPPALCWCGHCPDPAAPEARAGEGPFGAHPRGCRARVHAPGLAGVRARPVQAPGGQLPGLPRRRAGP